MGLLATRAGPPPNQKCTQEPHRGEVGHADSPAGAQWRTHDWGCAKDCLSSARSRLYRPPDKPQHWHKGAFTAIIVATTFLPLVPACLRSVGALQLLRFPAAEATLEDLAKAMRTCQGPCRANPARVPQQYRLCVGQQAKKVASQQEPGGPRRGPSRRS